MQAGILHTEDNMDFNIRVYIKCEHTNTNNCICSIVEPLHLENQILETEDYIDSLKYNLRTAKLPMISELEQHNKIANAQFMLLNLVPK